MCEESIMKAVSTNQYFHSSAVAGIGDRLATIDTGRKVGDCCAPFFFGRGRGSWDPI